MQNLATIEPVDYLVIGHITQDLTPDGLILGGTASYASLTARACGMRVGIVTACAPDFHPPQLDGIPIFRRASAVTSTFQNTYTPQGRIQHVLKVAEKLTIDDVPPAWRNSPIVHLGPLTQEIGEDLARGFPGSMVGVTPQGWLRSWDGDGLVSFYDWPEAESILPHVQAGVMSVEDVRGNEDIITRFVSLLPVLVVTEGAAGARVYWHGDVRFFRPPHEEELDPVGAGDVFSASFFIKYQRTRDPWEAARFATLVAANSVTRKGILGVPTPDEISAFSTEIIEHKGT